MLPWVVVVFGHFLNCMTGFGGYFSGRLEFENVYFVFTGFGGGLGGRLEVLFGWFAAPYPPATSSW